MGISKDSVGGFFNKIANPLATLTGHENDKWMKKINNPIREVPSVVQDMMHGSKQMVNSFGSLWKGTDNIFGGVNDPAPGTLPPDPHAPGSVLNTGRPALPLYNPANMPAPGTPTNGLANGAMSGGIDWAPIIARALRKT